MPNPELNSPALNSQALNSPALNEPVRPPSGLSHTELHLLQLIRRLARPNTDTENAVKEAEKLLSVLPPPISVLPPLRGTPGSADSVVQSLTLAAQVERLHLTSPLTDFSFRFSYACPATGAEVHLPGPLSPRAKMNVPMVRLSGWSQNAEEQSDQSGSGVKLEVFPCPACEKPHDFELEDL